MSVKEELQTLVNNMKEYRKTLLDKYDELMRKTETISRQVVDNWESLMQKVEFEVKEVIGNKYLTPPLTISEITYPKFKYVGKTFMYDLPKTVRRYELPSLPFFQFDMQKIEELVKHGDLLPVKYLFVVKLPKEVELEGDFEDTHWKYFMLRDVYEPWISSEDKTIPEDAIAHFLNAKGQHLRVSKILANHEVKYYYSDKYDWLYAWIYSGQIELYCYDTNEYYVIDGSYVELSPTGLQTGYPYRWYCGDKKLNSLNVLIIKTEKGVDIVELREKSFIENAKGTQMIKVISETYPLGLIGISVFGESIYSRRLETIPLKLT